MAEEKLPTRAEDFSEWYNQLVLKAQLADYAPEQRLLNVFPQRPPVWPHDHAAAFRRVVRQLRLQHQLVVPLGKILCACRKLFVGHAAVCPVLSVAICRAT